MINAIGVVSSPRTFHTKRLTTVLYSHCYNSFWVPACLVNDVGHLRFRQ